MARFHFFFFFLIAALALTINPTFSSTESYSESDLESFIFHQDYSPPSPPPPPPHGPSASCNEDLGGVGFLDSTCEIVADLNLTRDVYISGKGNFIILPGVRFNCAVSSLRRIRCKHLSFELLEDGGSRQISIVYQIPRWQVEFSTNGGTNGRARHGCADVKNPERYLPVNIKGLAGSIATLANWFFSWLITMTANLLLAWSSGGTFTLYGLVCAFTVVFDCS